MLLLARGNTDAAVVSLEEAVALVPSHAFAQEQLISALYHRAEQTPEGQERDAAISDALARLGGSESQAPSPALLCMGSELLTALGRFVEAESRLDSAMAADSHYARCHVLRAKLAMERDADEQEAARW